MMPEISDQAVEATEQMVTAPMLPTPAFDARLVSEYDGTGDVVEWWERARLLCELRGVPLMSVLPLRLTGGAFAVWSQLPAISRGSLSDVRDALYAAFALDGFAAYDAFINRRLRAGESADVFLAELRRLAVLFGGVPDRALVCAFVSGLPENVRQVIRAGSRAENLSLEDVLARARAVLSDQRVANPVVAAATRAPPTEGRSQRPPAPGPWRREDRSAPVQPAPSARGPRRCWICGVIGHISVGCPQRQRPENSTGEAALAPASSPGRQ